MQPVQTFANRTASMDSSSDDQISTIASLSNEFYKHFFKDQSESVSNNDSNLMVAMASILHEESEVYMPQ
jgi:hypothetical protein